MKNKLRMLFAYFRAFKTETVTSVYTMDHTYVEEEGRFYMHSSDKYIKPQELIINVIEELINLKSTKDQFNKYNNYDNDEYWYLEITIKPFENRIIFESECKYEKTDNFNEELKLVDLNNTNQKFITELMKEYELHKIKIGFHGRWGDGEVYEIEFDGRDKQITNDTPFWLVVNNAVEIFEGTWWNDQEGIKGDIDIIGDDVYIEGKKYYTELDSTELKLIITPDNVKEK
jgi:hypothetical protein